MSAPLATLLGIAAIVVIGVAIVQLKGVITPLLLAALFFVLFSPLLQWLRKIHLPGWLAVLLTLVIMVLIVTVGVNLVVVSLKGFVRDLPDLLDQLEVRLLEFASLAPSWVPQDLLVGSEISKLLSPAQIMGLLTSSLQGVLGALSNLVLIVMLVLFMLLEATHIQSKIEKLPQHTSLSVFDLASKVKRYLVIKAFFSLLTGLLIGVFLRVYGVDYPLLLGAIAFLLNFIPTIGSIVAVVPALLLVLVNGTLLDLVVVLGWYVSVNLSIGNFFEPRVMGKEMGISPLVVFLSLLVWGWTLGPVGMFMAVPLSMTIKIMLNSNKSTKWVAQLLS